MPTYNGVSIIPKSECSAPNTVLGTDACLTGCGAFNYKSGEFFHTRFPAFIEQQRLHINDLELLTIVVAVKLWGPSWRGERFKVLCDNTVAVAAMNMARMHSPVAQACMREIAYWAAIGEFELFTTHVEGAANDLCDVLSRWHVDTKYEKRFREMTQGSMIREVKVQPEMFRFSAKWW